MQDAIKAAIAAVQSEESLAWPDRSADVTRLLGQYLRIWDAATLPAERQAIVQRIFSLDGQYKDPMTPLLDCHGLVRHIEDVVLPRMDGFNLKPAGAPQIHGRCLLFSWEYVGPDGRRGSFSGSSGTDFVQISDAGLLQRVIGFFDVTLTGGAG